LSACARALGHFGSESAPDLLPLLAHPSPRVPHSAPPAPSTPPPPPPPPPPSRSASSSSPTPPSAPPSPPPSKPSPPPSASADRQLECWYRCWHIPIMGNLKKITAVLP